MNTHVVNLVLDCENELAVLEAEVNRLTSELEYKDAEIERLKEKLQFEVDQNSLLRMENHR